MTEDVGEKGRWGVVNMGGGQCERVGGVEGSVREEGVGACGIYGGIMCPKIGKGGVCEGSEITRGGIGVVSEGICKSRDS